MEIEASANMLSAALSCFKDKTLTSILEEENCSMMVDVYTKLSEKIKKEIDCKKAKRKVLEGLKTRVFIEDKIAATLLPINLIMDEEKDEQQHNQNRYVAIR